ncbi:MAG TPA: hypothetical protein VEF33_06950 [Syntrophales bacterium]|nr:hypothetical protein [Syntrophales bacterium]
MPDQVKHDRAVNSSPVFVGKSQSAGLNFSGILSPDEDGHCLR